MYVCFSLSEIHDTIRLKIFSSHSAQLTVITRNQRQYFACLPVANIRLVVREGVRLVRQKDEKTAASHLPNTSQPCVSVHHIALQLHMFSHVLFFGEKVYKNEHGEYREPFVERLPTNMKVLIAALAFALLPFLLIEQVAAGCMSTQGPRCCSKSEASSPLK